MLPCGTPFIILHMTKMKLKHYLLFDSAQVVYTTNLISNQVIYLSSKAVNIPFVSWKSTVSVFSLNKTMLTSVYDVKLENLATLSSNLEKLVNSQFLKLSTSLDL